MFEVSVSKYANGKEGNIGLNFVMESLHSNTMSYC